MTLNFVQKKIKISNSIVVIVFLKFVTAICVIGRRSVEDEGLGVFFINMKKKFRMFPNNALVFKACSLIFLFKIDLLVFSINTIQIKFIFKTC